MQMQLQSTQKIIERQAMFWTSHFGKINSRAGSGTASLQSCLQHQKAFRLLSVVMRALRSQVSFSSGIILPLSKLSTLYLSRVK
jgi:hypothetical protein